MRNRDKINEILKNYDDNTAVARLNIAAVICDELKKYGNDLVIVGGSAVEFYSAASYMTRDVDFIPRDIEGLKETMVELGFKNDGNAIWYHPDAAIVIEFPKGPLDGSYDKVCIVETPYGNVNIIGIEDIIIDRACGVQYWNDSSEWTKYLLMAHFENIDFEYLKKRAAEACCEQVLEKIIEDVKKDLNLR
ncbi:MAG: hypothetical protein Q4E98_04980 [Acidaminococcaceae bacterium]|uniref:hypothetical protein n=1 Tax=uncultured Phascolarctobacterium sp. TaxID=512296 RepID=UPI0025D384E7|nr:hypothetical protein [uncultured Phascolarctobacterium sp.]MDO5380209.1 hypothetical protein [Acidaminococcaceae bacterium]